MNKYLSAVILVATIVVAACSGGGSGTGTGVTVTTTSTWAISAFTASETEPFVGSVVAISASATKDGAPVPDGTTIEISVAYGGNEDDPQFGLGAIGTTIHRLASSNGSVTTSLIAETEGAYTVSVKVNTATGALTVTYLNRDPSTTLQIYQPLLPNQGSLDGGEQVTLNGKGILAPAEVDFEVNSEIYPGVVVSVAVSDPVTADGSITIRSPYISNLTGDDRLLDWPSKVTVRVGVSTADEQTEILPGAFTFLGAEPPPSGPQAWLGEPSLYLALPDHGQSSGGQQITLLGRNFRAVVTDPDGNVTDTPVAVDSVSLGGLEAAVLSVSPDGTQLVVQTPRLSVTPITADQPVDVVVATSYTNEAYGSFGPFTATLTSGFVYLADEPTPEITAISPTGGPIDGGEQVTIFGHGFQAPVQVTFGSLEAIGVEVNDDQSLADQDTIICVTPDYSQQDEETPVSVGVIVRNVLTGKTSTASTYTYGDNLYISGNTPAEGGAGDNIVIYGSGFEAPLQVDFGNIRLDVLSVSGTELLVRFPVDVAPSCSNVTASFTVTLIESGSTIDGGSFTFLASNPQIFGVDPIFVQETAGGDGVSPNHVTISGDYFSPDVIVEVGDFRIANADIERVSVNTIEVNRIPAPNDFGIVWDQSPCVTDLGLQGVRRTATPVDVTVINLPGNCSDTLAGGLVYEPEQPVECVVAPEINVLSMTFEGTAPGSCSVGQTLAVQNLGQGSLDVQLLTLLGPFYFDNIPTSQSAGPLPPIDPFSSDLSLTVWYCPVPGDALEGSLNIVSNDPASPTLVTLTAEDFVLSMEVTPAALLDFGPAAIDQDRTFAISNTGDGDLNWTLSFITNPAPGIFSTNPAGGLLPVGAVATVTVSYDPTGTLPGASYDGLLEVTATEAGVQGSPTQVALTATNP